MDIKDFTTKLFEAGYKVGFTDMEIYHVSGEEFEVTAYEKTIDSYKINTDIGLSFRGIIDGKMGYAFTEKFEEEDIEFLIKNSAQNARESQTDVEVSIFEGSKEYKTLPNRELIDEEISVKIKDALAMEEAALKYDKKIKSVRYCLVSTGKGKRKIVNTKGLNLEESSGFAVSYLSLVAGLGDEVKSGSKFMIKTDYKQINYSDIVKSAAEEAIARFGAKSLESGKYKIILKHDVASSLLSTFSSIFSSDAAQKGLSLLKGKTGTKIAADIVNIIDNPFYAAAPSNCSFDDEGVATYEKYIIREGILKTLLYNIKTGKKDNVLSTGNGFKPSYKSPVGVSPTNFYIVPGERSFEDAVKFMDKGLIITDLSGLHSGANAVSGDFSLAAEGFLVENGKIVRAIEQITIADNFYNVLINIEEILSDFEFNIPSVASFGSPSLIITEMAISGE
jgi:PmbA protein